MSTTILEGGTETIQRPFAHEPGDHDRMAHYVKKGDLNNAVVFGHEVEALCGHRWVPTKDPERFPVCQECQNILDGLYPEDES